jgi:L-rhamnonate dehydratase
LQDGEYISRIEWAVLEGTRPRVAGKNARLPVHGSKVRVPVGRVTTSSGAQGMGLSRLDEGTAEKALGMGLSTLFGTEQGTDEPWRALDFALWDLAGKEAGVPVYRLIGGQHEGRSGETGVGRPGALPGSASGPFSVPCYDTSLYFDDLLDDAPIRDHAEGAAVVAREARSGYERGHRAFKVKVGRGARWMATDAGLDRDVAVVGAVRDAIGPNCDLFADANNGYTLNLAKAFLERTASYRVGWLEEPFHEDAVLLDTLRQWIQQAGLSVLVADGESASAAEGYDLAARGLLDVVQCDILSCTMSGWLELGARLDRLPVASAPHHYGLHLGNYVSGHVAGAVRGFKYVEWDEATTAGISAPGYTVSEGRVQVPDAAGFGLELEEDVFARAVQTSGFDVRFTATR